MNFKDVLTLLNATQRNNNASLSIRIRNNILDMCVHLNLLTCELMILIVVFLPTSETYPSVGA